MLFKHFFSIKTKKLKIVLFFFFHFSLPISQSRVVNRFIEKYFPDVNDEIREREREEQSKFLLDNALGQQRTAGDIRKILRHKQKYNTEL